MGSGSRRRLVPNPPSSDPLSTHPLFFKRNVGRGRRRTSPPSPFLENGPLSSLRANWRSYNIHAAMLAPRGQERERHFFLFSRSKMGMEGLYPTIYLPPQRPVLLPFLCNPNLSLGMRTRYRPQISFFLETLVQLLACSIIAHFFTISRRERKIRDFPNLLTQNA